MPIVALVQMDSRRYALSRPRHDSEFCLNSRPPGWGSRAVRRIPPMLVLIRAGVFAALVTLASIFSPPISHSRRQSLSSEPTSPKRRSSLKPQIKSDAGLGRQAARADCAASSTRRSSATMSATAWCCLARSSRSRRRTARTGCGWRAPSSRCAPADDRERELLLERAGNRRLHRLSAHQESRRGGRQPAHRRPHPRRPPNMAAGARRAAAVAGNARGRRRARAL